MFLRNASLATSRSATATTSRLATRPVARVRVSQRYQTTQAGAGTGSNISANVPTSGSMGTHLAAGLAGGAAVLLGAYGYYHFSGAKKAVDASKVVHAYYQQTKATVAEKAPKSPSEALQYLRSVAKSYAGIIPGASSYVDSTFDSLDELHNTHGEELNKILQGAYDEIREVLKDVKDQESIDAAKAGKLMNILGKRVSELNELGKKAGNDAVAKLEDKYPMVAQMIGSSYSELKGLAQRGGPEAKKFVDDSIAQIQDTLQNSKNPQDAWAKARDLVQEKSQKLKGMVWDKAAEEAKENTELTKLLKENREKFLSQGMSIASLRDVLQRVKAAGAEGALDQGKLAELKDFVQKKAQETTSNGWEPLQEWFQSVRNGSDETLKNMNIPDVDIQSLVELSKNKSGDAKQLAEETYRDIMQVLQEKAGKAKKMAEEGKGEVKSKTS
ncbi:hypothetical protein BC835DRAFT_1417494 [Cytidiella melzeri]|nr:hypothetical protein BC835DRAFT_1417494 [Cytidiella melzeri]